MKRIIPIVILVCVVIIVQFIEYYYFGYSTLLFRNETGNIVNYRIERYLIILITTSLYLLFYRIFL